MKKEKPVTVEADQPKMPKYDYQKYDARSFSVGYDERIAREEDAPHSRNGSVLKIF